MPKIHRAILHIGTEKTGSTTIQAALAANRAELAKRGRFVPLSLCSDALLGNHDRLTTYALSDHKFDDDLRRNAQIASQADLEIHRIQVYSELLTELSSIGDRSATVLLSNEHCHSRLVADSEVERLHALLSDFFETVTVLVYLRPQHELAISLYDQALRAGYYDMRPLPVFVSGHSDWVAETYFDYDALLQRWSDWFGRENVHVRIYSASDLLNADVLDDYLAFAVGQPAISMRPPNLNFSIGGDLQPALNAINRAVGQGQAKLAVLERERLIEVLRGLTDHTRTLPSRPDVDAFLARFSDGNERVRARFRPERHTLFDIDLSRYRPAAPCTLTEAQSLVTLTLGLIAGR